MIRLRRGTVREVVAARPGVVEVSVEVEGSLAVALAYPALVGPVAPGDRVLLNTTAVWLGLGSGGAHFVVAVEGRDEREAEGPGHTMKLRYTPQQVKVLAVEEPDSPARQAMETAASLEHTPVVWVPLHSLLATVAAGAAAAGAGRVVYVMTDGAALPAPLSRLVAALKDAGLLKAIVTVGQAFGGDLEAITVFSGMLAARHVAGADVIVVGDGPGGAGTGTVWGASAVASAMSLNAAAALHGQPVATLRVSFADPRERHRVVSHHVLTALSTVIEPGAHVAVPAIEDVERRTAVWEALRDAGLERRHQLVEATGQPAIDLLRDRGLTTESMNRTPESDPEFFLAGGAAGILAGRMAGRDRGWHQVWDVPLR
jgi:hypothetical protein